ncbi:mechanosensitive ion channel [bacterium]|nr:mechanosensitive ion channel [bacterium]NCQ55728.1 mechanosensitive ion channel [Candidatus Parcubacteria bacterium]NCS67677.1 mechanosensitive ion channel [Candidatus Peregrinibacteria bacterium]NCS96691.1 mechanosensitive ion channel [bacterium]
MKKIISRLGFFILSFSLVMPVLAQYNVEEPGLLERLGVFGEIIRWGIATFIFVSFIFLGFFIAKLTARRFQRKNQYTAHKEVVLLVERATYFTIVILGGVIAFATVGIDLTWVLGPVGVGLGFAFKDLFGNIIAGMVILTQQKFKINDVIKINNQLGRITNIEMRTTDVQSFDGTNLIIPNADMLTNVVQNYTANNYRRLSIEVGVHYSTPLPYAIDTAMKAVKTNNSVVADPAPEILTTAFGESSITLEVRFWIESTTRWWTVHSEVVQAVKLEFDKAGITIPFPIRTLSLDPYDKNLLQGFNVTPDLNPSYTGYTAEDLQPNEVAPVQVPSTYPAKI